MSIDLLILGILWGASFVYTDFISNVFEPLFLGVVIISGLCYGVMYYFKQPKWGKKRSIWQKNTDVYIPKQLLLGVQTLSTYFLPLLLLFVVRSCFFDISRVVSGSLKPTILIGDTILINKYRYGIRLPIKGNIIVPVGCPKRGEIIAFRFPQNPSKVFIKRVIGLPNDTIKYSQKQLTINGEPVGQSVLGVMQSQESGRSFTVIKSEENLLGRKHAIYTDLQSPVASTHYASQYDKELSLKVPNGQYFVMGDNRDNSLDSRHWGFVPTRCLLGEVHRIAFSWDAMAKWSQPLTWMRWERLGKPII